MDCVAVKQARNPRRKCRFWSKRREGKFVEQEALAMEAFLGKVSEEAAVSRNWKCYRGSEITSVLPCQK